MAFANGDVSSVGTGGAVRDRLVIAVHGHPSSSIEPCIACPSGTRKRPSRPGQGFWTSGCAGARGHRKRSGRRRPWYPLCFGWRGRRSRQVGCGSDLGRWQGGSSLSGRKPDRGRLHTQECRHQIRRSGACITGGIGFHASIGDGGQWRADRHFSTAAGHSFCSDNTHTQCDPDSRPDPGTGTFTGRRLDTRAAAGQVARLRPAPLSR